MCASAQTGGARLWATVVWTGDPPRRCSRRPGAYSLEVADEPAREGMASAAETAHRRVLPQLGTVQAWRGRRHRRAAAWLCVWNLSVPWQARCQAVQPLAFHD